MALVMAKLPLILADRRRRNLAEPDTLMRNRYLEPNPILSDGDPSLTARPGIRGMFQQAGAFHGDLFVMSGKELYRVDKLGQTTLIANDFYGSENNTPVYMACTGDVGSIPPFLFIADGQTLRVYTDQGFASNHLQTSGGAPADNDVVRLGDSYYKFVSTSVNAGTPAGTLANPWLVKNAATFIQAMDSLKLAINGTGVAGTDYSTNLTANLTAQAQISTATGLYVYAREAGAFGNAVVTTETSAALSWAGGGTLTGGGSPTCTQIAVPNDVAVLGVAYIKGFLIVLPAQGSGINGRFYWIEPGSTIIDPLNFATAERSPDAITQVIVFNDQFWLCGQTTTEVWYVTTDVNAPMMPLQGVVLDRGVFPGTAVKIKDLMILVDQDGGVFEVKGGEQRISSPDIEERIRQSIVKQNMLTMNADS
jgi:hypothetical protein